MKPKKRTPSVASKRAPVSLEPPLGVEAIPRILAPLRLPPEKQAGGPLRVSELIRLLASAGADEAVILCARLERGEQRPAHGMARVVFSTDPAVVRAAEANGFPVTAVLIGNEIALCEAIWVLYNAGAKVSLQPVALVSDVADTATVGRLRAELARVPGDDIVLLCTPDENADEPRLSWLDQVAMNIPGLAGPPRPGETAHVILGDPWLRETMDGRGSKIVGRVEPRVGLA